jgi:uncharacterized protein with HEPN domain
MKRTDEAFVGDILTAAASIRDYIYDVTEDDFLANGTQSALLRDGVIRQVGIVGEAASKLSPVFRTAHTSIPWRQIIGMRNIVVHQYWEVDLDVVWEVATQDIPALVRELRPPPTLVRQRMSRRRF